MNNSWNQLTRNIKHKFKAKKTEIDGQKFDSKIEARYFQHLRMLKKIGEVMFFLTQVPVRLPGGTSMRVDFQVFYTNGTVRFIDVKGVETDSFKIKKREIEAVYPFKIELVKKGDF